MLSLSPMDVLQANADHFSVLVTSSTITVALGVAMEGVELIHDAAVWIKRRRLKKKELADLKEVAAIFPASQKVIGAESNVDHPGWVKRFTRVGLILVVIGVVGEWRYGAKLEDAHNAIHEYDVAKLTAAEKEAGNAAHSAEIAHAEADAVKGIADEARADAKDALAKAQMAQRELAHAEADSSKAAAAASDALTIAGKATEEVRATKEQADEIRDEIAWRHLSSGDSKKVRDAIPASLRGYKIEVRHLLSDPEAGQYASEIADALRPVLNVDGNIWIFRALGKNSRRYRPVCTKPNHARSGGCATCSKSRRN